jgi:hypothetical protein
MVKPTIKLADLEFNTKIRGDNCQFKLFKLVGTGKETKCSFAITNELPDAIKTSFKQHPALPLQVAQEPLTFFEKGLST